MPLLYANATDYESWSGEVAPANVESLLRAASSMVRGATRAAFYTTTPTGLPSDEDVLEAFRDAVCAQAYYWARQGIDPYAGQTLTDTPRVVQSESLASGSVTYGDVPHILSSVESAAKVLAPEPIDILTEAGLLGGLPVVYG